MVIDLRKIIPDPYAENFSGEFTFNFTLSFNVVQAVMYNEGELCFSPTEKKLRNSLVLLNDLKKPYYVCGFDGSYHNNPYTTLVVYDQATAEMIKRASDVGYRDTTPSVAVLNISSENFVGIVNASNGYEYTDEGKRYRVRTNDHGNEVTEVEVELSWFDRQFLGKRGKQWKKLQVR